MEFENEVCSLGLSNRLKALGYPQKGVFWWWRVRGFKKDRIWFIRESLNKRKKVVAPTVAELGEKLPKDFVSQFNGNNWACFYNGLSEDKILMVVRGASTEAEARGLMWEYLRLKEGK